MWGFIEGSLKINYAKSVESREYAVNFLIIILKYADYTNKLNGGVWKDNIMDDSDNGAQRLDAVAIAYCCQ